MKLKNKLRKLPDYQYRYFIIIFILFRFIIFNIDNDFWFTINQGRYVLEHGFPHVAINTIHNLDFIYQSWGSGVTFYLIYNYLGNAGIISFLILISFITVYFFYKLCMVVSEKKHLSLQITLIFTLFYIIYLVCRPHVFTILNLIIILYLLESFLKNKRKKYLYLLPIITLFQINMHGIYFIVLLIIILPYFINSFKFNLFNIIKSDGYEKKDLFISYGLMFLTGFINPYGYKTIIYGFKSYGQSSLMNNTIHELLAPNFHYVLGKLFIITIIIIYIIYFRKKDKIPLRYYLLLLGTSYLALDAMKSFYFFLICTFFPLTYIYKNSNNKLLDKGYSFKYHITHLSLTVITCIIMILNFEKLELPVTYKYVDYLDSDILNKNKEDIKVYTNFYDGSYLEYRGYYCYIDPRSEVYLKVNNHKEDIYQEYHDLQNLKIDYLEFLYRYDFDYLLLNREDVLYYLMNYNSSGYEEILSDDNYKLMKRVTNEKEM